MAMSSEQIRLLDAYWRAANVKPRLLGHWGTSPGLSFIYAHLNRLVRETDADVIYLAGPGHGGPAIVANVYLEGLRERDEGVALAVAMFVYQARKQVGALAAALGGLDTLVFTGGIGERAAPARAEICDGLGHLGVHLDPARNAVHGNPTGMPGSACQVRIVATREDLMIARHTRGVLFPNGERRHRGQ